MALPSNVNYGTVVGVLLRALIDGGDSDRDPDGLPLANLTVRFTADIKPAVVRNATSVPPTTIVIDPVVCTTDAGGVLVGPDGLPGIRLVAGADADLDPHGWSWSVYIAGDNFPAVSFSFILNPNETVDISSVVPVPPNPGEGVVAWQEAVSTTLAAKAQVLAARDQVLAVPATTDGIVKGLLGNPASQTSGALAGTFAPINADTRGKFLVPVAGGGTYHHNDDTKAGAATSATYKTKHPVYVDDSRPTVTLVNSTDLPKVGGAANPQPLTMAEALIGPDGVIRQARFGGSLTVTLQPGESVTSDPIENLTLVRGTDVFALSYVSAPVAGGWRAGYLITNNAVVNDGLGRVYGADATATGAGITGASDTGAFYAHCPVAISGRATVPARAVSIMADSIGFGAGATGGDYLRSFVLDALSGGRVPYVQFSRSGGTLDQAGNSPTAGMIALAGSLSDDCILELATNDFSNGKTAAQVEAASLAMAVQLKTAGVKRVWRTTVTPRSSGAVGAQVPHSSNAARQSFNAWARSGSPVDPVTLVQVAPGTLGALLAGQPGHPFAGVLDLAALVEDGITGTWKAAYYGDGLHPNDAGHTALQAGVRADLFGGSTTSPKNYLSTWFPKKIYSSIAGVQLTNGRLYLVPFHVPDASVRVDQLVMNASNAGSAEGVVRSAIYAADAKGRPLTLVADLGTKTPTYGATYWTIPTPITLQPGRYFMALISQGAPVTPPSYLSGTGADPLVTGDTAWIVPASNAYILNGVADGALPSALGNTIYGTAAPFMQVRAVG